MRRRSRSPQERAHEADSGTALETLPLQRPDRRSPQWGRRKGLDRGPGLGRLWGFPSTTPGIADPPVDLPSRYPSSFMQARAASSTSSKQLYLEPHAFTSASPNTHPISRPHAAPASGGSAILARPCESGTHQTMLLSYLDVLDVFAIIFLLLKFAVVSDGPAIGVTRRHRRGASVARGTAPPAPGGHACLPLDRVSRPRR